MRGHNSACNTSPFFYVFLEFLVLGSRTSWREALLFDHCREGLSSFITGKSGERDGNGEECLLYCTVRRWATECFLQGHSSKPSVFSSILLCLEYLSISGALLNYGFAVIPYTICCKMPRFEFAIL